MITFKECLKLVQIKRCPEAAFREAQKYQRQDSSQQFIGAWNWL